MIRISVHEAKTHLSRFLAQVQRGEIVVICNRNVPVAELRPISSGASGTRALGCMSEGVRIDDSFFDPLPDDVLRGFEGPPTGTPP